MMDNFKEKYDTLVRKYDSLTCGKRRIEINPSDNNGIALFYYKQNG